MAPTWRACLASQEDKAIDQDLVERSVQGDQKAFRQLVERKDRASSPTEAILTDVPFVGNVLAFLAATVFIVYRHMQS